MKCPKCGGASRVYETKQRGGKVIRRRQCKSSKCAHRWQTREEQVTRSVVYTPTYR